MNINLCLVFNFDIELLCDFILIVFFFIFFIGYIMVIIIMLDNF